MTEEQARPLSEAAALQALQATLASWHEATAAAWRAILANPSEAHERLIDLWRRSKDECASFEEVLRKQPDLRSGFVGPARLWMLEGAAQAATLLERTNEALWAITEGLRILDDWQDDTAKKPQQASFWNMRADLERRGERFDEAIVAYDQAFSMYAEANLWDLAVMALSSRAGCDLARDHGDGFLAHMKQAIDLAERHDLKARAGQLRRDLYRFRIETDPTGETLEEVDQLRKGGKLREALCLDDAGLAQFVAEARAARRDPGAVREQRKAIDLLRAVVQGDPTDVTSWARLGLLLKQQAEELAEKDPRRAREIAREALTIAEEHVPLPDYLSTILGAWLRILDRVDDTDATKERSQALERLAELGSREDLFQARVDEAFLRLKRGSPAAALAVLDEAESLAETPDQLRLACMGRIVLLQETPGRQADALDLSMRAIDVGGVFHPASLLGGGAAATRWSTQLSTTQSVHGNAAVLLCRAGRVAEAFRPAEQGRALRLRARMEEAGLLEDTCAMVPLDALQSQLREDAAALALFWVGRERTLALVVDPFDDGSPQEAIVPLGQAELRQWAPSEAGNPWGRDHLAALGDRLWPCLKDVIARCRSRGGLLYLAPDAELFTVPFAALPDGSGGALVDHCAVAFVPGATVWSALRARRTVVPPARRVVACAGEAHGANGAVIRFRDQARAIADLMRAQEFVDEASGADLMRLLIDADLAHLEFHGIVEPTASGVLSASALRCRGDEVLTADELAERLHGRLRAQLIFLNACMSGRFRGKLAGEVGGLWEALMVSGATSLVASLHEVDPAAARDVAQGFYSHWPGAGATRGEALRQAQLAVRAERPEHEHWAAHVLIGDAN